MKKRRLGQHYLADRELALRIVELAKIRPTERILEIGTGKGALTRLLAGRGASLVGYEVDRANYDETLNAVAKAGAQILLADAFEEAPEFDVLVASLPYSESSRFVAWLSTMKFDRAVVMLQEDFARKIQAPPGDREYRGISALAQIAFDVKVLELVGRGAFTPRPSVGSAVVSFRPRLRLSMDEVARIVRLFSLRRRQVGSALAELGMEKGKEFGRRRVYWLAPEEVHELCR